MTINRSKGVPWYCHLCHVLRGLMNSYPKIEYSRPWNLKDTNNNASDIIGGQMVDDARMVDS